MNTRPTRAAAAFLASICAHAATGAPTLTENFNDNSLDPALWGVFEDFPSIVSVDETNARLEISSPGNAGADATAVIYNRGWALDATKNFKWKVTFAVDDPGPITGELGVTAVCWFDGDPEIGGGPDFTAVTAGIGREGFDTYFGSAHIVDAVDVDSNFVSPSPISEGTVYFSYNASTDTISVSAIAYDGVDAVFYSGLRANSSNTTAGIALGGFSAGPVVGFTGDMAWGDNLVVNAGTLVNPCPADIDGDADADVDDIEFFVDAFIAMDPAADIDGDGDTDVDDIESFVSAFLDGCS